MTSKWFFIFHEHSKQLWFRASLYCVFAVITALFGAAVADLVPASLRDYIAREAVHEILQILASSMLVVATFALTAMVHAYSAAATTATPRATQLLTEDTSAQNALAAFIGAFLFSIVGLFALSAGIYGEEGSTEGNGGIVALFASTIAVVLLVIMMLLRWIEQLARLGRVEESIDLVEAATTKALVKRAAMPCLGGRRLAELPQSCFPVASSAVGYVQYIDVEKLQLLAERHQFEIYINVLPGSFCDRVRQVAFTNIPVDQDVNAAISATLVIGGSRTFQQDPRFGFIVLAEIAVRALSPAVNDPGTAIDVIGTSVRLFSHWARERREQNEPPPVHYNRIWTAELREEDFFEDVFSPIAREGAGTNEVCIRLQKALRAIGTLGYPPFVEPARRWSEEVLVRCKPQLTEAEFGRVAAISRNGGETTVNGT